MTRMRSILLGATSLVLVLAACSSGSPAGAGNSSGGRSSGSSSPAVAGNLSGGGSSTPAVAGNSSGGGSRSPAVAGRSLGGGSTGAGLVAVRSGTAATSVEETDYLKFVPASVNVKVGDIVVFTNAGSILHNVTFPYAGIGSPTMKRGNSFLVKFTSPGTYPYVCTLHFAGMLGTVTVR